MENEKDAKYVKSNTGVHFFYVTVYLVSIIVLLAAFNWTTLKGFTDYLTVAGTMVSIVLGMLAIIYSFISNDSVSKSLGGVSAATNEMQNARREISEIVDASEELVAVSKDSAKELGSLLMAIKSEVQGLKDASALLQINTADIANAIVPIPEQLGKIQSKLDDSLKPSPTAPVADADNFDVNLVAKQMLTAASQSGRFLFVACALSKETGKSFPFKLASLTVSADDYSFGYLIACKSARILDYEVVPDQEERTFLITSFLLTSEEIIASFKETAKKKSSQKIREGWEKRIAELGKYFE